MPDKSFYDEVRTAIHREHGVSIGKDDPILMIFTAQKLFVEKLAASQDEMMRRFREDMQQTILELQSVSKKNAETIINASIEQSVNIFKEEAQKNINRITSGNNTTGDRNITIKNKSSYINDYINDNLYSVISIVFMFGILVGVIFLKII